jgi:hypothetical protein
VLRVTGQTETTPENIQDCLELDEGDPGFQLLEEIAPMIKSNPLILFRKTVAVYCENNTEHTSALCGQNAEF